METQQPQTAKASLPESIVQAQKARDLIAGKVVAVEKNGFVVDVAGIRSYCALNKMSEEFIHIKNAFIGKELNFIIEGLKGGVPQLSRVAALGIENARLLDTMAGKWRELDQIFEGKVLRLTSFGAFIDIGGLEGLIPISELAWGHTEKAEDVVKVGDKVKVKIIRWEKTNGRHKVSFSRKDLLENPWSKLDEQKYRTGARLKGTVSRFIPAGAVIAFEPGIEALLHPEEISWDQPAIDPATVLEKGSEIEVLIAKIDRRRRQMNASLKFPEQDPWKDVEARLTSKESHIAKVTSLNSAGANVQIEPGIEGFLPVRLLQKAFESGYRKKAAPGNDIEVTVKKIDRHTRSLVLSLPQLAVGDEDTTAFREYEKERRKKTDAGSSDKLGSLGALLQAKLSEKK